MRRFTTGLFLGSVAAMLAVILLAPARLQPQDSRIAPAIRGTGV